MTYIANSYAYDFKTWDEKVFNFIDGVQIVHMIKVD